MFTFRVGTTTNQMTSNTLLFSLHNLFCLGVGGVSICACMYVCVFSEVKWIDFDLCLFLTFD